MARMMAKSLTSFRTCRWRGLVLGWPGQGPAPGTPPEPSTSPGRVAMQPGWPKDAHPRREVAAAPEALECSAGEESAPKEQEGDEGDVRHILAAGPQEVPASTQALGPAQPSRGGRRLWGQGRERGGVTHGHLGPTPAPHPTAQEQGLYLQGGQGRGERRVIPCRAVTCKGMGGQGASTMGMLHQG